MYLLISLSLYSLFHFNFYWYYSYYDYYYYYICLYIFLFFFIFLFFYFFTIVYFYYIDTSGKNNILFFVRKILFCHSKIKFISSCHRVISSIYYQKFSFFSLQTVVYICSVKNHQTTKKSFLTIVILNLYLIFNLRRV